MTFDLHLHSHYSDGTWSPHDLVQHAIKLKLRTIALTDHDTTAGIAEAVDAARDKLSIIPAIEINAVRTRDGKSEDIHILGYFIDCSSRSLQKLLNVQREARMKHAQEIIDYVSSMGIALTLDDCRRHAGKGALGKAHITQAIVEAGGAKDVTQAYEKFMTRGSQHYRERNSVSPEEAIAAINDAGGIASIAHPGKAPHMEQLILDLQKHGLRAVEAYHRMHSVNVVRRYIRFANRNGLLVTGGSDCHGPFQEYAATMGSISVPNEVLEQLTGAARPSSVTV